MVNNYYTVYHCMFTACLTGWRRITRYQTECVYQEAFCIITIRISANAMPWNQLELQALERYIDNLFTQFNILKPTVCTHCTTLCINVMWSEATITNILTIVFLLSLTTSNHLLTPQGYQAKVPKHHHQEIRDQRPVKVRTLSVFI